MAIDFSPINASLINVMSLPFSAWPITMAGWWRRTNASISIIMSFHNQTDPPSFNGININMDSSGHANLSVDNSGTIDDLATTATSGLGWHHVTGVFSSNTSRTVYLDGANSVQSTVNVSFPSGLDRVALGRYYNYGLSTGYCAEVGVWNVELNTSEIAALGKGVSPLLIRPENLLFYSPLIKTAAQYDLVRGFTYSVDANAPTDAPTHPPVIQYKSPQVVVYSPILPDIGGNAYGEESPTNGETPVGWSTWSDGAGGSPNIAGDPKWGQLVLESGEEARSPVLQYANFDSREYTINRDLYGTGSGSVIIEIRGSTTQFSQDDVSPSWTTYSGATTQSWQYVQVRLRRA